MSELNPNTDSSIQSEIQKIMFSFQIESPPEIITENQEFLADNIIDDLVDCLVEESEPTLPQVNVYELPVSEPVEVETNHDLELENSQLKAKITELESVINSAQTPQENPETELLINQLEIAQQTIKNQQLMIETLSRQLAETQEHLSNLERECSQVQDNYNQQTYKLLETEKQLQELHGRLLRQQRYTLEYKTVLEECFKESSATILLANNSVTKPTPESQEKPLEQPKPKAHWPSPGIDRVPETTIKKMKKAIDLPTFM
ncbi:MAG: hypothetical protein EA365_09120 [Gloeocapsa sp. DLM2.Bin57]|nr:MAG: hypothetical protein EA365_09120 [Gloeocapsa sp. DLM2.Bin57]